MRAHATYSARSSGQSAIELGRLLADARGYAVFAHGGAPLGVVDRVRYEHEVSRPDDIVVRSRTLFRRHRRTFPFAAVAAVNARENTLLLRADAL